MPYNIEILNAPSDTTILNENWTYIWTKDKFDGLILEEGGIYIQEEKHFSLQSLKLIN